MRAQIVFSLNIKIEIILLGPSSLLFFCALCLRSLGNFIVVLVRSCV